jgi:superfamily II DNA/RNA helicase
MFSATLGHKGIQRVAARLLMAPELVTLSTAKNPHVDIRQQLILADHVRHKEHLLAWLLAHETYEKALVFTNTRAQADKLGGFIRYHKQKAAVLHGEMDQKERNRVMDLFRRGYVNVLVATDVAARGLDVQGVDLVINFEIARSGDDYVHRIGRTGRAGRQGLAITLIGSLEWNPMSSIERYLNTRFERRTIKELPGAYKGPKKLKSSGKAAGSKKRKLEKKAAGIKNKPKKTAAKKVKGRSENRNRSSNRNADQTPARDGFAPLKRAKTPVDDV